MPKKQPRKYPSDSPLVNHAEDELERAGLFDPDSDYNGALAHGVMHLIQTFSKQGHSGFSAAMTLQLFEKLANFKTLTPITDDPDEWHDVSDISGTPMWQNKRDPSYFSRDEGKTWYNLDTITSKANEPENES